MTSVSVIIPAFNRPRRLKEAIESVLSQNCDDLKLVVVDDKSTEPLDHCRNLVLKSGHRWIDGTENLGPGPARNRGAYSTSTEFVSFLDSDDLWLPKKIERQLDWHRANPEVRISQVQEKWIRNGLAVNKPAHLAQPDGDIFESCVKRCAIGPSCVMIRRDLWVESGGFDPWFRVCEDYELWLRIASREKVGLIPGEPLVVKHGGNPDQLSTQIPALDRYRLVALAQFLNNHELSTDQKELVVSELRAKSLILAKGAAKRNRTSWGKFFRELKIPLKIEDLARAKDYCK